MNSSVKFYQPLSGLLLLLCLLIFTGDIYGQQFTEDLLSGFAYRGIGPTRQSGRFVDFAVPDPEKQPYTFYAATGSGGLWKTTNNGQTFTPIFDYEKVISIGDVTVSWSDPDIVWVGTGEANNSRSTYWGDGVYKSTDAGETWTNMGLPESHHIGRIVIHPSNPDVVYVAALGHLYSENPDRGLYKSTNGGRTWNKILCPVVKDKHIGVVDVAMDPSNSNVLYACTFDKVRVPFSYDLGGPGSRIYKTTDGGASWEELGGGLPKGMLGRIGVCIYPKNPNIVYASIENANKPGMSDEERYQELLDHKSSRNMIGGEVYRSDDTGATWRKVSPEGRSIGGSPGYYYGQIIVDPSDDKRVYVLSVGIHYTEDGGETWTSPAIGGGDNHALWIDPADSNHMLLGYDHGMKITYDGGRTSYHPDELPLAQFYAIGVDMSYPYRVAGGLQDNGSHMGPSTRRDGRPIRLEDWISVGGGDGMYNVFDWKTNRYIYNESQFGPISRLDLVTGESKSIRYNDRELRWNWCAPILVSPHNSDVIYHGANKLLRSPFRGEFWEVISEDLTTNDPAKLTTGKGGDGNIQYCTITTIDESPITAGVLWVGTDDGNVQVTRDGGQTWTKLNDNIKGNPGYWVSRVTASHHYPGRAYVSYTGLRRDDFGAFVYKTEDFGETWTSIAGNLPAESINVIKEDHKNPNLLFVGTDLAVYVTIDGGENWTKFQNNMPTQPVHDLVIHPRENDLVVGTHGRGIFITDISPLQELTPQVLSRSAYLFDVEPKVKWVSGPSNASSSINFTGPSEPAGVAINYYLREDVSDEVKVTVYKGARVIFETTGPNTKGINTVRWNMTMTAPAQMEQARQPQQQQARARAGGARGGMGGRAATGGRGGVTGARGGVAGDQAARAARLAQAGRGRRGGGGAAAGPGVYRVTLTVGDRVLTKNATILEDVWH
ncbi:MAG: glycosyl hydrolase [Phycisphaerae bacterium SM23_30]|nr:MAG: glycosyl hydrolase [Phycisphaerae bacterium SM23_30]